MTWIQYLIIIIYVALLFIYFYTETLGRSKIRALNKMLMAMLYLVMIIINYFTGDNKGIEYILIIALILTFLGDGILLLHFPLGALFFTFSNIVLIVFDMLILKIYDISFSKYFWGIFIMASIWGIFGAISFKSKYFHFTSKKWPLMMGYVFFVTIHGILGIVMISYITTKAIILLGVGELMYMLSDYILVTYMFSKDKNIWILRLNSALYFIGILLISMSVLFF